jgi:hypothetical protein
MNPDNKILYRVSEGYWVRMFCKQLAMIAVDNNLLADESEEDLNLVVLMHKNLAKCN